MTESFFTSIYKTNAWGSKETVSGHSSTLVRTETLRSNLPTLFEELYIKSILDCGCGDFNWFQKIPLESTIQYLGVDIVEPIIVQNQNNYSKENIHFQKMNVLEEPPETADLWILRDVCGLYSYDECRVFLKKFIESTSKYLAITSIEKTDENVDGMLGTWRALDLRKAPFHFPEPTQVLPDGQQWFRKKFLYVYTSDQLLSLPFLQKVEQHDIEWTTEEEQHDPNALGTNVKTIPLRLQKLHTAIHARK
jgi:hypothetical protein